MPWLTIHHRSNNLSEFRDVVAANNDSDQCHALNETAEYKSPEFPHVSILIPLAHESKKIPEQQMWITKEISATDFTSVV